jgi:acyl carrier protein
MLTSDQVLEMLRTALAELFELDPGLITLESRLGEDLEIDSIDAVDLLERLRRTTGKKMSPEDFRSVRTVGDLVATIERLTRE